MGRIEARKEHRMETETYTITLDEYDLMTIFHSLLTQHAQNMKEAAEFKGGPLSAREKQTYKADTEGLICLDVLSGVNELLCNACAYQTSQSLCAAKSGGDAQAYFGLAEHSVLGANTDITGHGDLATAAQCKSVDRCDHRDRELLDLKEKIVTKLTKCSTLCLGHCAHRTDVRTCDK